MRSGYSLYLILVSCMMLLACPGPTIAESLDLEAPDGSDVTIHRDEYGVPHITGTSDFGVFYGQGVAVAQDRLTQMETNRRAATGRLAEVYGNAYISYDQNTRKLYYTPAQRQAQFAAMPANFQAMVGAYVAGINTYIDWMNADPATYRPQQLAGITIDPWTNGEVVAVTQYFMRRFGEFGGEELTRLSELNSQGQAWFDLNRPINDPAAPTTIPTAATPQKGGAPCAWRSTPFSFDSALLTELASREAEFDALERELALPPKFGSFAVQIAPAKSATGNAMLLGCPQMGTPVANETNAVNEVELSCPALHVGGMTVAGIPGVIIGHTASYTWTFTSGISDNVDVYIETTQDASLSYYLHNQTWQPFTTIADTVYNHLGQPYPFTIYRSIHGPVFMSNLSENQAYTYKMTFWDNEMLMAGAMYDIFTGEDLIDFEAAVATIPMSFNVFYTGADQTIKFWHAGWYQDRTDGVDPRLPHNGDGTEEWGGLRPFASLPEATNPAQNYFVNWNNKPVSWWDNGDNVPWSGWHPVNNVDNYIGPIGAVTFEDLKGTPQAISSHGTYQQAIEFTADTIVDENIVPPGQSEFVSMAGVPSPHVSDQWPLHIAWRFKDMLFGFDPSGIDITDQPHSAGLIETHLMANPFKPYAEIQFRLSRPTPVRLEIFDFSGRRQATLLSSGALSGHHTIAWNGLGNTGQPLPTGLYLSRLQAGDEVSRKKLFLLRR
jgi:penicillin G amidase